MGVAVQAGSVLRGHEEYDRLFLFGKEGNVAAPSILIFNEDIQYVAELVEIFQRANYHLTQCYDQAELFKYLLEQKFDLLILDICPSEKEFPQPLVKVRQISETIPILILTKEPCLDSAIAAIRNRVDDYLFIPIQPTDLLNRVQSILDEARSEANRTAIINQIQILLDQFRSPLHEANQLLSMPPSASQLIQEGQFTVNLNTREVIYENKQITLSPTELNYLVVLLRHRPNVVSHKTLVVEAQGFELSGFEAENLARWHIHTLRKVLEAVEGKHIIHTVRGLGYSISL
jgi:DNA-binding response OmpR family regulator